MKWRKPDPWSGWWFLGAFFLDHLLRFIFGITFGLVHPVLAELIVIGLVVVKELLDSFFAWLEIIDEKHWFWDHRGGSFDDIVLGILGTLTALFF